MADQNRIDGRSLRYQHRRPELLAAALEHVLEHGPADLSLRALAAAVGVTHATLLRHFGTKEDLLAEVLSQLRREVIALSDDDFVRSAPTATAQLRRLWDQLSDARNARQFLVLAEMYGLARRDPDRYGDLLRRSVHDWVPLVEAGLRRDGWPEELVTPTATAILAQIRGLQLDLAATGDRQRVDRSFALYLDALDATRPATEANDPGLDPHLRSAGAQQRHER